MWYFIKALFLIRVDKKIKVCHRVLPGRDQSAEYPPKGGYVGLPTLPAVSDVTPFICVTVACHGEASAKTEAEGSFYAKIEYQPIWEQHVY